MEQDTKKISFGFSKSTKKPILFQKPLVKPRNVQLIDCLEAQTIKIKGVVEKAKGPLIIPMVQSAGNILDRKRELKIKAEAKSELSLTEKPDSELTADELAARELIRDAKNANIKTEGKIYSLPIAETITIEGKEEATMEDYENVPISDYGMAMLRGMGWAEGAGIGKNKRAAKVVEPDLRPKGMGLGADKSRSREDTGKPAVDKDGKELILKKGSYAKIVYGKQKGSYCEVQGLDDESGRVIVKTTLQGLILSLNEFLVKPVTKEEYIKSSKVLNNAKYDEYQSRMENSKGERSSNRETKESSRSSKAPSSSKERNYSSNSEDSEVEYKSKQRQSENGREGDKYKKKSKKKQRSLSRSSEESYSDRRKHRERARSSSASDDYKRHDKKKSKSRHNDKSSSESDYSCSKKSHKSSKHKRRHN